MLSAVRTAPGRADIRGPERARVPRHPPRRSDDVKAHGEVPAGKLRIVGSLDVVQLHRVAEGTSARRNGRRRRTAIERHTTIGPRHHVSAARVHADVYLVELQRLVPVHIREPKPEPMAPQIRFDDQPERLIVCTRRRIGKCEAEIGPCCGIAGGIRPVLRRGPRRNPLLIRGRTRTRPCR